MFCSPSTARSSWPFFFAATSEVFVYEQLKVLAVLRVLVVLIAGTALGFGVHKELRHHSSSALAELLSFHGEEISYHKLSQKTKSALFVPLE
jgi:hypothetical protein